MSSSITGFRVQRINDLEESLQRFPTFDDDNDDGFLIDSMFQQLGMGRPLSDADSTVVCESIAIGGKSHGSSSRSSNHDDNGGGGDVDLVSSVFQQLRMGQPPSDDVVVDDITNHHHGSSTTSLDVSSRVIIIENNVPDTIDEEDMLVADIFDQLGMGTPPSDDEASDLGSYTSDHIDHEEDNYGAGRRRLRRTGPSSSANGSNRRRRRRGGRFPGMVRSFARRFRR